MAFFSKLQFLFFFLNLFSLASVSLSNIIFPLDIKSTDRDIHDLFPEYHIPIGLLPGNVKSYHLNPDDNSFTVELTHHCYVYFEDQLVYYDTTISGKLTYGRVYDVHGIQAKKFFIWVSVDGMEINEKSHVIEFHVGIFTDTMPIKDFLTIPVCHEQGLQEAALTSV